MATRTSNKRSLIPKLGCLANPCSHWSKRRLNSHRRTLRLECFFDGVGYRWNGQKDAEADKPHDASGGFSGSTEEWRRPDVVNIRFCQYRADQEHSGRDGEDREVGDIVFDPGGEPRPAGKYINEHLEWRDDDGYDELDVCGEE